MQIRVTHDLQPELLDLLRSLDLEYQYCYTINSGDNKPRSIAIGVECTAISMTDLECLSPWGHFIISPVNDVTLELFTSLPDDINKCII